MENYERAAELDPENTTIESLFRIYTALGMFEEAEAAMEKQECNSGVHTNRNSLRWKVPKQI